MSTPDPIAKETGYSPDPAPYLELLRDSHTRLHYLKGQYEEECVRRRGLAQQAVMMGATQQEVADVLGIARANVASGLLK